MRASAWAMSPLARAVCASLGGVLLATGLVVGRAGAHHHPTPATTCGPAVRYPDGWRYCVTVTLEDPDHPGPEARWVTERYHLTLGELCRVIPDIACPEVARGR